MIISIIIEICDKKITVNNLLDEEIYANLSMDPKGFIFRDIYKTKITCVWGWKE